MTGLHELCVYQGHDMGARCRLCPPNRRKCSPTTVAHLRLADSPRRSAGSQQNGLGCPGSRVWECSTSWPDTCHTPLTNHPAYPDFG